MDCAILMMETQNSAFKGGSRAENFDFDTTIRLPADDFVQEPDDLHEMGCG